MGIFQCQKPGDRTVNGVEDCHGGCCWLNLFCNNERHQYDMQFLY